ncbi:DNA repair protein endonuclease SAE2/CtIP C-terminus-domain-containing protein [Chaetomium sp. MPI-SDFR-AT-0129]|nr:DNA repair protein endonuclease SAE2/CtIP C-terminus-domain-containing protein [Chaetomium sp. MPI-SDFR-AT-0129]
MEYWAGEGRAKLRATLETVCDSVEDQLAAAIQEQTAHQHASLLGEIDRLKTVAARVDDLEKENRSLVEELSHLRKKLASQNRRSDSPAAPLVSEETPSRTTRPALAEVSANRQLDARVTKSSSSAKQIDWKKEYSKVYVQKSALEERCEGLRGSANRLREARDSWTTYAQSLETKLEKLKKAQHDSNSTHKSLDAELRRNDGNSAASSTDKETQDGSDGAEQQPPLPTGDPERLTAVVKEEPSSDPVVVSERVIRKRKIADDDIGMPAPPRKIKYEKSPSSEPVIISEVPVFCPHESIDLDEGEVGMPTPRKQPEWEQRYLLREERSGNTPPGHYDTPRITAPEHTNTPAKNATVRPNRSALGEAPSPVKARWSLSSKIADLAEDEVDSLPSPRPNRAGEQPTHGRLHSLLNDGSPMKPAALLSPVRPDRDATSSSHEKENIENLAPGEHPKVAKKSPARPKNGTTTPMKRMVGSAKGNAPAKASRLRDRPLADLAPEDFKVNPRSNDGYRYAFDEVVRSREERAELAGCTDPNCCGRQFKAMAESELSAGGSAILSRPAEIQMMEKYLGDGEAYRLVNMTRQERQETWLKAKVQDLADRYGRHRHRFARRPSPPGYWNPDFPSTQEIEQNKEEAKRVERGVVEERWREAMRGGRWLFRDE